MPRILPLLRHRSSYALDFRRERSDSRARERGSGGNGLWGFPPAGALTDEQILEWERAGRKAERVAAQLARRIRSRYQGGQLLPSNAELASQLDTSGETVGNAKKILEVHGLITRGGRYHYVAESHLSAGN